MIAERRGDQKGQRHRDVEVRLEDADERALRRSQERGRIAANGEERRVAQIEQAGETDHDVQSERQHRVDQDRREGAHLAPAKGPIEQGIQRQEDDERDQERVAKDRLRRLSVALQAEERGPAAQRLYGPGRATRHQLSVMSTALYARSEVSSPSSPVGLKIRMTTSRPNTTACGPARVPHEVGDGRDDRR